MANSLLDFVMSLVRDPDAAARYAADPAGTIADAHLTDVNSADVNNLIPMVADSLSMAAPTIGGGHVADANVWASGAATTAFDAFDAHLPDPAVPDTHPVTADVIQQPADSVDSDHALVADPGTDEGVGEHDTFDSSAHLDESVPEWSDHGGWEHTHVYDSHPGADHPGFEIF